MGWSFLDFTGLSRFFGRLPEKLVTTDTTQTIPGTKSFSSTIIGSVSGSAAKLQTARTINGTSFNGTADITTANWGAARNISITDGTNTSTAVSVNGSANVSLNLPATIKANLTGNCSGSSGSCTGNAATATTATTAEACTGNAATATKLAAKRTIALSGAATGTATAFDGSGNITIPVTSLDASKLTGTASVSTTGNAATATTATTATNATYANWLRTSSHSDHLFHTEWDRAGYFWTYVTTGTGEYRAVRVARSDSSSNADTATKLAAKRTIALSGAATGTATGFDGSGNITIPVTALSGSAITSAITIYDLVPDGAANHRNFYRGKDLTAAFNAGTVSANIANGSFRDIFPGDYITKQITVPQILKADSTTEYIAQKTYTVKFIIADLDIWLNRGDTATTAHHAAIVPERVVFNSCMNETNVTDGGYAGSFMNTNVMPAFAAGLQNAFGASHLISFRIGLSNGVTTTTASASHPYWTGTSNWWGAWTSEICCLMSEGMVYGQSPNHSAGMDETMCGQFAAFRLNSNLVYNRQNYWLSDVVSSAAFAVVTGYGSAVAYYASNVFGVRPFALLR